MPKKSGKIREFLFKVLISIFLITLSTTGFSYSEEPALSARKVRFAKFGEKGNLLWSIESEKSIKTQSGTNFTNFQLSLYSTKKEKGGANFSLSGNELYLPIDSGQANAKGTVKLTNNDGINIDVQSPSWNPSKKKLSGRDLFQAKVDEDNEESVQLLGKDLTYNYGENPMVEASDFIITYRRKDVKIELSGEKLLWEIEKEINMKGNVRAKTESGWRIDAEEMTFDRKQKILTGDKGVTFLSENKEISGNSFKYFPDEERISIQGDVKAVFLMEGEEK